jgi:hypothetical protein
MPLKSDLFMGDPKLEACAVSHPAHITPGAAGDHVAKIQIALRRLDRAVIDQGERSLKKIWAFHRSSGSCLQAAPQHHQSQLPVAGRQHRRHHDDCANGPGNGRVREEQPAKIGCAAAIPVRFREVLNSPLTISWHEQGALRDASQAICRAHQANRNA